MGTAPLHFGDNHLAHSIIFIGDNKHCLVGLEAIHHDIDNLAFNHNQQDGVNRQAETLAQNQSGQRNRGIDNDNQSPQRKMRVLVDNHRNDIATARSGPRLENQADRNPVNQTGHNRVHEIVRHEPHQLFALADRTHHILHIFRHRRHLAGIQNAVMQDRRVAPIGFNDPSGPQNHESGQNRLETETRPQNQRPDNQQRNIHASRQIADLPMHNGIQNVRETVSPAGRQTVRRGELDVPERENNTPADNQQIGNQFLLVEPLVFGKRILQSRSHNPPILSSIWNKCDLISLTNPSGSAHSCQHIRANLQTQKEGG